MAAVRTRLLNHLRVRVVAGTSHFPPIKTAPLGQVICRFLSDELKCAFLDKSEVYDRVLSVFKAFKTVDLSKVTQHAHFQKDLGLDSLDSVEIMMALEEEFGFEILDEDADKIKTIDIAVNFIASHPHAK